MSEANDETKVVLIVGSDGAESGALGRALKRLGCEAQTCWDMHAALIAARAERPTLVISSTELLDGDGFTLCDLLRAEPTLEGVPIVLLCTASVAAAVRAHEASPKRADAYVFGPLPVAGILEHVAKYLSDGVMQTPVDDDEISLSSAVEVVSPASVRRPPPPMRKQSATPPPPRVPRPSDAIGSHRPSTAPDQAEIRRLREELRAAEARHSAALEKQREELERAFRAEKEALEAARQNAESELKALEKVTELQLADMMRQRDKARAELERRGPAADIAALRSEYARKLADVEQNISRARDSLIAAMRGVER